MRCRSPRGPKGCRPPIRPLSPTARTLPVLSARSRRTAAHSDLGAAVSRHRVQRPACGDGLRRWRIGDHVHVEHRRDAGCAGRRTDLVPGDGSRHLFAAVAAQRLCRNRGIRVRWVGYGGAPIAPSLVSSLKDAFPQARAFNGYGMAESAGLMTIMPDSDAVEHADSVGYAVPSVDLGVIPLGDDPNVGELTVRGPMSLQATGIGPKPLPSRRCHAMPAGNYSKQRCANRRSGAPDAVSRRGPARSPLNSNPKRDLRCSK